MITTAPPDFICSQCGHDLAGLPMDPHKDLTSLPCPACAYPECLPESLARSNALALARAAMPPTTLPEEIEALASRLYWTAWRKVSDAERQWLAQRVTP